MDKNEFDPNTVLSIAAVISFMSYIIWFLKSQPIGAFLFFAATMFITYCRFCESVKQKEILEHVIKNTIIGVLTALALTFSAVIFRDPIANEINRSIQQTQLVDFYAKLSEQGKHGQVVYGIDNLLRQKGLLKATQSTLTNIKTLSEDVLATPVSENKKIVPKTEGAMP